VVSRGEKGSDVADVYVGISYAYPQMVLIRAKYEDETWIAKMEKKT